MCPLFPGVLTTFIPLPRLERLERAGRPCAKALRADLGSLGLGVAALSAPGAQAARDASNGPMGPNGLQGERSQAEGGRGVSKGEDWLLGPWTKAKPKHDVVEAAVVVDDSADALRA
jgi:hypothetical protein